MIKLTSLKRFFKKPELELINSDFNKHRPPCPFYGFHPFERYLHDQSGNQCPILTITRDRLSTCKIKTDDVIPDWNNCSVGTEKEKANIIGTATSFFKIFPEEFRKQCRLHWKKGIPFRIWMEYVMNE